MQNSIHNKYRTEKYDKKSKYNDTQVSVRYQWLFLYSTCNFRDMYMHFFLKNIILKKKLNLNQILFVSSVQVANESVRDIWDKPWDQEDVCIYHI